MRRVGTFIFGRPRPLSGDRRADPNYTLDPEEPLMVPVVCPSTATAVAPATATETAKVQTAESAYRELAGSDAEVGLATAKSQVSTGGGIAIQTSPENLQ